jgi:hypothetical protein
MFYVTGCFGSVLTSLPFVAVGQQFSYLRADERGRGLAGEKPRRIPHQEDVARARRILHHAD